MNLTKYITSHLDSRLIFVLDLTLAIVSSAAALFIINFFTTSGYYAQPKFAILWLGGSIVFSAATMLVFKTNHIIIRHSTLGNLRKYVIGIGTTKILQGALIAATCIFNASVLIALGLDFLLTVFLVFGTRVVMIDVYDAYRAKVRTATATNILVFNTTDRSVAAINRFKDSTKYHLCGFVSANPKDKKLKLAEYPVFTCTSEQELDNLASNLNLSAIIFPTEQDATQAAATLIPWCSTRGIKPLIASIGEYIDGRQMKNGIRQIRIEDLLGRPEIKINLDEIKRNFAGKVVMVTGAAGSIGSELCRQLAGFGVKKLILFDNAETPMHNLRLELEARFPELDFVPVIGSVRHADRLEYAFRHWWPQVVFHAAAYKHVPLMEENPCEAVFANVYGTRMVADKCVEYGTEMMVMISTDKAVNPTNIMGCSKRLAEIYVQSLGLALAKGEVVGRTKFVTTRFGNVLGSNGSVIPRFREQIEHGGPVTVTHPDITRFFMTIPEACRLVMEAATLSTGNQIFVFDMGESVKIADLATRMIELAGLKPGEDIQIEYTGLRPGEKLYEEVLATTENTIPTSHERIRIAKVREYSYAEASKAVDTLSVLSREVEIDEMVKMMKRIVPEFKSKNSPFEKFDA